MDFFNSFIKTYWYYFFIALLCLLLAGFSIFIFIKEPDVDCNCPKESITYIEDEQEIIDEIYVDIKGAVKTPGVYKMAENSIIDDAIKEAGGFTKKAYTRNINLSKVLSNEMVIIVYTQSEYKELNKEDTIEVDSNTCVSNSYNIDSCIQSGNSIISTDNSSDVSNNSTIKDENKDLDELIQGADFPEDYDAFDDEMLDMIP